MNWLNQYLSQVKLKPRPSYQFLAAIMTAHLQTYPFVLEVQHFVDHYFKLDQLPLAEAVQALQAIGIDIFSDKE